MVALSRRTLLLAGAAGTAAALVAPSAARATDTGQPYAPNWFPTDVLTWSPDTDPDALFNRSTTPLAQRVVDAHTTANPDARPRRLMGLSVFGNTDGNPSQGSAEFDYYTSEFWQYLHSLVFWGGSASEGLILAPNPTVTDAAHRNGVPVHGTIFFPPTVYGGNLDWVRQLVQRDALGRFPVAAKLGQIARWYGFEGWFVNQETAGADAALAEEMRAFVVALKKETRVIWYDAMNTTGAVGWQGRLDDLNAPYFATADEMFVDFRWDYPDLPATATYARGVGRDPNQLFPGIDTGWRQFKVQPDFDALFGADEVGLGAGLYRPDFTLTSTDDKTQYAARESRFWVGADANPATSTADADGWRGVSAKVAEHAVVTALPFETTFNTGHGRLWAEDGVTWQTGGWNNLTAQDVLPTWRWLTALAVDYDYARAWRGGSSLRITGHLDGTGDLPLYATRVRLGADTRLAVTASGGVAVSAVLRFLDAPEVDVAVPLGRVGGGWTRREASLARWHGRTLIRVGLRFAGTGDVEVHVGRLALGDCEGERRPVREARIQRFGTAARITWHGGPGRYDVHAVLPRGGRTWLGCTTSTALYVAALPAGARVEVLAS